MRVCDACYLGGGAEIILVDGAKHRKPSETSYNAKSVWTVSEENPEFCPECFELFKAKNWVDLGKRQATSMRKILTSKSGRRASDTP